MWSGICRKAMGGRHIDGAANEVLLLPGPVVDQALIAALCREESDEVNEERASGCQLGE